MILTAGFDKNEMRESKCERLLNVTRENPIIHPVSQTGYLRCLRSYQGFFCFSLDDTTS